MNSFRIDGISIIPITPLQRYVPFLKEQVDTIYEKNKTVRPWQLCELHNPWSRSAIDIDSWKFLELCQAPELIELLTPVLGENIILYDSQFYPDLFSRGADEFWSCDDLRCPVTPLSGLVVRIIFQEKLSVKTKFYYQTDQKKNSSLQDNEKSVDINHSQIILHDIKLPYRLVGFEQLTRPMEYIIRYFPATSHYTRDPCTESQQRLTEAYPLLNYTQMPLWLIQGEDMANNDFITGFQPKAGRWIKPSPDF